MGAGERFMTCLFSLDLDEFDCFTSGSERANFVGSKTVTANIYDLSVNVAEDLSSLKGMIIMIPQADPGYDWLFGHEIAGLITMFGGANSHMAIRAAEFGLPAGAKENFLKTIYCLKRKSSI